MEKEWKKENGKVIADVLQQRLVENFPGREELHMFVHDVQTLMERLQSRKMYARKKNAREAAEAAAEGAAEAAAVPAAEEGLGAAAAAGAPPVLEDEEEAANAAEAAKDGNGEDE